MCLNVFLFHKNILCILYNNYIVYRKGFYEIKNTKTQTFKMIINNYEVA